MKYNNFVLSLFFLSCSAFIVGMDKKPKSPTAVSDEGVLLMPQILKNREIKAQEQIEAQESRKQCSREDELGVLLTPKVVKKLRFNAEFYKRKDAGATCEELLNMNQNFYDQCSKKEYCIMAVYKKYQPCNHTKNDDAVDHAPSDCCSLILSCFGVK